MTDEGAPIEQGEPAPTETSQPRPGGEILTDRAASIVIYVVTAIWAGNILAGMLAWNGYQPSTEVNGIFMAVVGGAFIARTRNRSAGGGGEK